MSLPHKITIEHIGKGRYRVHHDGKILIEATRQPEFDACRALLAQGIVGRLETWRSNLPYPCMRLDIEAGAQLTVEERDNLRPRFRRWTPHPAVADQDAVPSLRGLATTAEIGFQACTLPRDLDASKISTARRSSQFIELGVARS